MEVAVTPIDVSAVRVQREVSVPDRASPVGVLVAMRVKMSAAVTVRVLVHCVGVVVVSVPIRVGSIGVILIRAICVIAMAVVQMICVRYIPVVLVRGRFAIVVVIAMPHIPEVLVRRFIVRAIEMPRAGLVGMITVGRGIAVIPMEEIIGVIGMSAVDVIIEREIPMPIAVIAMVGVEVTMKVDMGRRIRMVGVRVCVRDIGVRRRIGMRHVGMRSVSMVIVRSVGVRRV